MLLPEPDILGASDDIFCAICGNESFPLKLVSHAALCQIGTFTVTGNAVSYLSYLHQIFILECLQGGLNIAEIS